MGKEHDEDDWDGGNAVVPDCHEEAYYDDTCDAEEAPRCHKLYPPLAQLVENLDIHVFFAQGKPVRYIVDLQDFYGDAKRRCLRKRADFNIAL